MRERTTKMLINKYIIVHNKSIKIILHKILKCKPITCNNNMITMIQCNNNNSTSNSLFNQVKARSNLTITIQKF